MVFVFVSVLAFMLFAPSSVGGDNKSYHALTRNDRSYLLNRCSLMVWMCRRLVSQFVYACFSVICSCRLDRLHFKHAYHLGWILPDNTLSRVFLSIISSCSFPRLFVKAFFHFSSNFLSAYRCCALSFFCTNTYSCLLHPARLLLHICAAAAVTEAKVLMTPQGRSKGMGYVAFANEARHDHDIDTLPMIVSDRSHDTRSATGRLQCIRTSTHECKG